MYFNVSKFNNIPILKNSFGTDDITSINIYKNEAKIDLEIPLFYDDEGITNKIGPVSLIRSSNQNNEFNLGIGIGINLINKITTIGYNENNLINLIVLYNSKNEAIYYELTNVNYILETESNNTYIVVDYLKNENGEIISWDRIKLYDLNGNYLIFENVSYTNGLYPSYYHRQSLKSDEDISINVGVSNITFSYENQEVCLNLNTTNGYKLVTFSVDYQVLSKIELGYNSTYLTNVNKYLNYLNVNNVLVSECVIKKEYVFNNEEYILVKNIISEHYTKYYLDSDKKVTSFVNCFESNEASGKRTSISYEDEYTRVSNYKNQITKYLFDNNKLVAIIDPFNKIMTINYDSENSLIETLKMMDMSDSESNKRGNLINTSEIYLEDASELELNNGLLEESERTIVLNNLNISKNSGITFFVNTKRAYTIECSLTFTIRLTNTSNNNSEEKILTASSIHGKFIPLSKMFITENSYDKVEILIKNTGKNSKYFISSIQLYNHLYGSIKCYNQYGKVEKIYSGDEIVNNSYIIKDNTALLKTSIIDINSSINSYDEKGNVIEVIKENGVVISNEYDENNNLIRNELYDGNTGYIENTYEYYDSNKIKKTINQNGNETTYLYDRNDRVLKNVNYPNNLQEDFDYYDDFNMFKHKVKKSTNDEILTTYEYDIKKRIDKINLDSNYYYKFNYDTFGNISSTEICKNNNSTELDKTTYEADTVYTENVKSYRIGKTDSLTNKEVYDYDEKNNLKKIYANSKELDNLLYEFEYDVYNNLIKVIDYKNNETIDFQYDVNNNLISEEKNINGLIIKTNYIYDLKNKLLYEKISQNNNLVDAYSYNVGKASEKSLVKLHNYYKCYDDNLYTCFLLRKDENKNPKCSLSNYKNEIAQEEGYIYTGQTINLKKTFSFSPSVANDLSYIINNDESKNRTIAFWFKCNGDNSDRLLLSIADIIETTLDSTNKISKFLLRINEENYIKINGYIFDDINPIKQNEWNFVSLTLIDNGNSKTCKLNLNGQESSFGFSTIWNNKNQICFGNSIINRSSNTRFNGEISCLFVSLKELTENEVSKIYNHSSEHFINYDNTTLDYDSITNRYKHTNNLTLIPLNETFESLNNEISFNFEFNDNFYKRIESNFTYDKTNFKDYVYKVAGNKLEYLNDFQDSFAISFNSLIKEFTSNHFLCELKNNETIVLSLYVQNNGLLSYKINDEIKTTNIYITPNTVNKYYLSLLLSNVTSNGEYVYTIKIKVNNDDTVYTYYYYTYNNINFNKIVFDKKNDTNYIYDSLINMIYIKLKNILKQ